jgi:hypothetical protein
MIRRSLAGNRSGEELLIPQDEHARQAGRLAALLLNLAEPREAIVRAVALHDAGWPCRDDAPQPLPNGRSPHIFDAAHVRDLVPWRRSVAIARTVGRLEGLLVSRHFSGFAPEFAAEQAALEDQWRIGIDAAVEEAGVRAIRLCDALSLVVLCDPGTKVRVPAPYSVSPDGVVDPWPFRVPEFEDTVVGRAIPRRDWAQSDQLAPIYSRADLVERTVRFRPKSSVDKV